MWRQCAAHLQPLRAVGKREGNLESVAKPSARAAQAGWYCQLSLRSVMWSVMR